LRYRDFSIFNISAIFDFKNWEILLHVGNFINGRSPERRDASL